MQRIRENAARIEAEGVAWLIPSLRAAGIYSHNTNTTDVRVSLWVHCRCMGLRVAKEKTA